MLATITMTKTSRYRCVRLHREDVDLIESELKKIGGVPFTVWAKGVATLSAEEIQELIIRAGRRRIAEAEAVRMPIYQYGTGKQIGRAGEKKK